MVDEAIAVALEAFLACMVPWVVFDCCFLFLEVDNNASVNDGYVV
jgi:hypothetical protein